MKSLENYVVVFPREFPQRYTLTIPPTNEHIKYRPNEGLFVEIQKSQNLILFCGADLSPHTPELSSNGQDDNMFCSPPTLKDRFITLIEIKKS